MPKYQNIGWLYPKKHFATSVASSWETIAAIIIPPYGICQRYTLKMTAATASNDNTALQESMYWGVKGLYFPIPPDTDLTSDDAPMTYVNKYCPLGIGEWADGDTTAVDTEFPGHFDTAAEAKKMQFFDRERALHAGDGTSMVSGDNKLTFADNFSTSGNPYKQGMGIKVEDTKMLVFIARGDIAGVAGDSDSNWSDVLSGTTANGQALTQELWKQLGHGSDVDGYPSGLGTLDTNVQQWLLNGKVTGGSIGSYQESQVMYANTKMSVRVKMVAPMTDRHKSAG